MKKVAKNSRRNILWLNWRIIGIFNVNFNRAETEKTE